MRFLMRFASPDLLFQGAEVMRLRNVGVVLLGLLLAATSTTWAQVTTTGRLQVIVEDPSGGRLPGVAVTASAADVVTTRTAVSDAEGVATLEALAPSSRYTVKAELSGFKELERTDILIRSGQVTTLRLEMALGAQTEVVQVVAQTPLVDVTRATSGQDITLQLTESLPTGRTYQSYLQLVPGVMPDTAASGGNPASRSGVNWKDASTTSDNVGSSADNQYYFEGVNVTDPVTGTFGANLNTEIIQEQKVITGGLAAEYVGAAGLVSTVITKSGSNQYSGSYNYFFRNEGMVGTNIHSTAAKAKFNTKDTAFTLGGPAMKDHLWGFGSFRYTNTGRDIVASDTLAFLRKSETIEKQGFAKATYAPAQGTMISYMFLNDPFKRTSDTDPSIVNNRTRRREQGGNNNSVSFSQIWGKTLIDAAFNMHDAQISDYAANDTSKNTVNFQTSDVRTLADEQLGGFGQNAPETRPTTQFRIGAQRQISMHKLKAGFEWAKHEDRRNTIYTGPDKAQYTSISNRYLGTGVTAGSIASNPWSSKQFVSTTTSDFSGLIATFNASPKRAQYYAAFDTNGDGTISVAELNSALVFNSTAGNPDGQINYYRSQMTAEGPRNTATKGYSIFVQDEFAFSRFAINVGVRAESLGFYATTGARVFKFDTVFGPRASVVYDIKGDGSQKASFFYGRYYTPLRVDMANFTGTATGAVTQEQIYVMGDWVPYRTRGGATTIDGFFSPATKTPYTDEIQLQYEADLGHNTSVSAAYYNRKTRDVFEDFDPELYTVPSAYGDTTAPNSLFLGWDYFGWSNAVHPGAGLPPANFFLGTLPGGKRDFNGLELVARRRFSDNWQALVSYNYLDAKGNAVSVGNADFAGDVIWLDPRAPNMMGTVPGTIHHLFKAGGSYTTKWGIELGGGYSWNSGTVVNKTQSLSSRRLPIEVPTAYTYGGISARWVDPTAVGALQNPGWGKLDLRIQYTHRLLGRATGEAFLDIFNVTNNQGAIRRQDLAAGSGTTKYGDEFVWLSPRNGFMGFRVRF
jgi:hypothetical protein